MDTEKQSAGDEQSDDGDVAVSVDSGTGVAVAELRRPWRRNALTVGLTRQFADTLGEVAAREDVRLVLLRGQGSAFCAGADFGDFEGGPERGGFVPEFHRLLDTIAHLRVPVMAAVQGPAVGAGCQIAAQCDLVIAAESAAFGITGAKIGLMLDVENMTRLVCELGPRLVRRLLLTGELLSAREAEAAGLVHRVVADDGLDDTAAEWAGAVAAKAPLAVEGHKAAIQAVVDSWWLDRDSQQWCDIREQSIGVFGSADLREGLAAFGERRAPKFRRR